MYYSFMLDRFPSITDFYISTLNTDEPNVQLVDSSHRLCMVLNGSCAICFDGDNYNLREGDIIFIPANHQFKRTINENNTTLSNIVFSVACESRALEQDDLINHILKNQDNMIISPNKHGGHGSETGIVYLQQKTSGADNRRLKNLFDSLSEYENTNSMLYNIQISVLLCNILIALTEETLTRISHKIQPEPKSKLIRKIEKPIEYIHAHYTEKILLDDICTHCNISKSQLTRIFKTVLDTTPSKYISNYKLSRAKELLFYYPDMTINEISTHLGFDTQHYFSKQFSQAYGMSPTYYRKKKLESNHTSVVPEK